MKRTERAEREDSVDRPAVAGGGEIAGEAALVIKAVFFDVDGTLISHTIGDIPRSTLDALAELRKKGILLFLSTGRHIRELELLPLHHYPFDGYVTQTGQICYDRTFTPIYQNPFSRRDTETLTDWFRRKAIPMVLVNAEAYYINYINERVRKTQASIHTPLPNIGEYQGEPLFGATVFGTGDEIHALTACLPDSRESSWHSSASDIIAANAGKADGIQKTLEHFGLCREEVMAFGDADNDLDMIQYAQVGVAMGNGTERLKQCAEYVTASVDEDGVKKALEHYGLI